MCPPCVYTCLNICNPCTIFISSKVMLISLFTLFLGTPCSSFILSCFVFHSKIYEPSPTVGQSVFLPPSIISIKSGVFLPPPKPPPPPPGTPGIPGLPDVPGLPGVPPEGEKYPVEGL